MTKQGNLFGGSWTQEKLERVRKYLSAYPTALKKQPFDLIYIDAFAGTGYVELGDEADNGQPLFPEFVDEDATGFIDGSARMALNVKPGFKRYVFIERSPKRFRELQSLREDFPDLADAIVTINEDANTYLEQMCSNTDWRGRRAVLFLDPYGMQVRWRTLEVIAETRAIDVWILFPLGVAVNRLLRRDGNIDPRIQTRLDELFGTHDWYHSFYREEVFEGLFGAKTVTRKIANVSEIGAYFLSRLRTIFAGVADNPLPLYTSRGSALYLLCFAVANPGGARLAIKIAQEILKET